MDKIFNFFDLKKQSKELGVSIWKTPSFLFLFLGIIIIIVTVVIYIILFKTNSFQVILLIDSLVVVIIFVSGYFFIQGLTTKLKANQAKSEFISIISHQLKTPISSIRWQSEFLLKNKTKNLNEKQIDMLKEIGQSGFEMSRLVNSLLDVVNIGYDNLTLSKIEISIVQLVNECIRRHLYLAKASNIKIELSCFIADDLKVVADERRIKNIIENLILNAIKYTRGKGLVQIRLELQDESITICVKDNGIGIPKYQHSRVFKKFFRADNAVEVDTKGTGIELFIAKHVIEQSGGKFWFDSIENVGSTFCFSLPITIN